MCVCLCVSVILNDNHLDKCDRRDFVAVIANADDTLRAQAYHLW